MIRIPGGTFTMGSSDGRANEKPPHRVTVAAFEMDRTEVTVAAYSACVKAGMCSARTSVFGKWYDDNGGTEQFNGFCNFTKADKAQHPMNCVDWNDAATFCGWAGKRLPTEEQWEYAARGTDGRVYPWGNQAPSAQLCWNRDTGTCAVGSLPSGASPFGLLDMAGNVWEWTSSGYSTGYRASRAPHVFVSRGGGWDSASPSGVRAANRGGGDPTIREFFLGFRCSR